MAKDYARSKCFVKKNGQYEEITYEELQRRCGEDETYKRRKFLPLHGMLMEVSEEEYIRFYRLRNRQKYLQRAAAANQEISFDSIAHTVSGENSAAFLCDPNCLRQCFMLILDGEQMRHRAEQQGDIIGVVCKS